MSLSTLTNFHLASFPLARTAPVETPEHAVGERARASLALGAGHVDHVELVELLGLVADARQVVVHLEDRGWVGRRTVQPEGGDRCCVGLERIEQMDRILSDGRGSSRTKAKSRVSSSGFASHPRPDQVGRTL